MSWKPEGSQPEFEPDPHVHGPGEDAAAAAGTANSGMTRTDSWRREITRGPRTGDWTCSQCGNPGREHKGLTCPPPATAGFRPDLLADAEPSTDADWEDRL